jgi:hypothetical protein
MNRQALAQRKKVLRIEHSDTLTSVYCFAYLLSEQHPVNESLRLYQRASAGYNTTLEQDHPTTVACHRNYTALCALQE